jgi:hypothetical protein
MLFYPIAHVIGTGYKLQYRLSIDQLYSGQVNVETSVATLPRKGARWICLKLGLLDLPGFTNLADLSPKIWDAPVPDGCVDRATFDPFLEDRLAKTPVLHLISV